MTAPTGLERRVELLEEERGDIAAELGGLQGSIAGMRERFTSLEHRIDERLAQLEQRLDERPSRIELTDARRAIDSIRAKAALPLKALSSLELTGPGGLKAVMSGFSGMTIAVVILVGVAGIVAWLVLR